jgi:hypothetical protein
MARTETITKTEGGFEAAFADPRWPAQEFTEAWLCVPTTCAVLIPAELDRPEHYPALLASPGGEAAPAARILSNPLGDKTLLFGVCEEVLRPLSERFGERFTVIHPLTASLLQPVDMGTVLRIDGADGLGCFTLTERGELRFADVFPLENDASLLLIANRILANSLADAPRIVCSGEHCQERSALLSRQSRNAVVHPDGEQRNLFFPLLCG